MSAKKKTNRVRYKERGGLLWWFSSKKYAYNAGAAGTVGPIPRLGRSLERGMATNSQYSCLKNPMDREAWQATVPGVAKSWT